MVGAVTVACKASGPALLGRRTLPPRVAAVVDVRAPAMLAALVVTQTVGGDREIVLDERYSASPPEPWRWCCARRSWS